MQCQIDDNICRIAARNGKEYFEKKFTDGMETDKYLQEQKFKREIAAYDRFMQLGVDFVPHLVDYDVEELTLRIRKVNGYTLTEMIELDADFDIDFVIDRLIYIDAFLYDHRINYLHCSPHDLLFDIIKQNLLIVDFEYTFINSSYKQILYDRIFHPRMMRVKNVERRNLFLHALRNRKTEFKHYRYRRLKNSMIARIRSIAYDSEQGKKLLK
jgi:tRNA A-37 threonylcarbamoyl transferase component Bud32